MNQKFDVSGIVTDHWNTLVDHANGKRLFSDVYWQFIFPAILAALYCFFSPSLANGVGQAIDQAIVAAFAIFTALLFNLQIMMMGLLTSLGEPPSDPKDENDVVRLRKLKEKKDFIRQIFYNISYSILVAILLVSISIIVVFFDWSVGTLVKAVEFFLVGHFLLVGLMVLKRTHSLFTHF